MGLYEKLELLPAPPTYLLSKDEALAVFDKLIVNEKPIAIKHELILPLDKIIALENKLIALRGIMKSLVRGTEVKTEEVSHIDEITGNKVIDTPVEYYAVPTSLIELQNICLTVINDNPNYGLQTGLLYTNDLNELIAAFNYVISEIIRNSNYANDATFDWWKSKVLEQ